MIPVDYHQLSELDIRSLCMWREAQGEGNMGKRGVGWVIQNRIDMPCWWGHDAHSVVLKPYQFSSFNPGDPNEKKWPQDGDRSWLDCQSFTSAIMNGTDTDITNGADYYHDISVGWPSAWGNQKDYAHTLDVGRLMFYRFQGTIQ